MSHILISKRRAIRDHLRHQDHEMTFALIRRRLLQAQHLQMAQTEQERQYLLNHFPQSVPAILDQLTPEMTRMMVDRPQLWGQIGLQARSLEDWWGQMELLVRLLKGCQSEQEKAGLLESAQRWMCGSVDGVLSAHRMFKIEVISMVVEVYIQGISAIRGMGQAYQTLLMGVVESMLQIGWPTHPHLLLRCLHLLILLLQGNQVQNQLALRVLVGQKWNTFRLIEVLIQAHASQHHQVNIHVIQAVLCLLCNLTFLTHDPNLYLLFIQPSFLTFHSQVISHLEMMAEGVVLLHLTLTLNLSQESAPFRSHLVPHLSLLAPLDKRGPAIAQLIKELNHPYIAS